MAELKHKKESTFNQNRGFTLVETLVAISILSISILGVFTAVQSGLHKSSYARDEVTAFYLAQEAVEYIRNIRDSNGIASYKNIQSSGTPLDNWLSRLTSCISTTCVVDPVTDTITPTTSPSPLYQNGTTFLFGQTTGTGWTASRFTRTIRLDPLATDLTYKREIMATVTINWGTNSFVVKELFTNNKPSK